MKKFITFVIAVLLLSSCSSIAVQDHFSEYGPAPLLTFVFDDGNDTDYLVAMEVFKKHGAKASFAVVTDWINTKNHMTVSQLRELQDNDFEIMSHTVSHSKLKSLTDDQIEYNLSVSKATIEGWGLKVNNLAYPYNNNSVRVRELASKYYRSARGGQSALNQAVPDRYELKSYPISNNIDKMKALIDRAGAERKWLILYLHNIVVKVKVSQRDGVFQPGETLLFSPSGAKGRYGKGLFNWYYFVPLSEIAQAGDTIVGLSSGATCHLDEILYNKIEVLTKLIEHTRSSHFDMRIVTINEGLDICGVQ
ncbi:MAG: polysaccharide deacetylase family protein [Pseudomonadota bacterium]